MRLREVHALPDLRGFHDMVGTVTATRSSTLFNDGNGDGRADPGDTILTHIIVNNTTGASITGVTVDDPANGTTVVSGSVLVSHDDNFSLSGNTPITENAASGVLANDYNGDGAHQGDNTGLTVTAVNGSGIGSAITVDDASNGAITAGTVSMNSDGSFTFTPATGYTGTAEFTYNVTDAAGTVNTSTVYLGVGSLVWYVDGNAATNGDGSYANPFNNLASLSGHTAANDSIVVHNSVTGSVTLQNGESLYGDGSSLIVNGHQITNSGAHSTISYSGVGITLASGNTIDGVDLVGTSNTAQALYDNNASVGSLTINHMAVSGQGQIADISHGGTIAVTLDSASSTALANNVTTAVSTEIYLGGTFSSALSGTFTVNGATTISGGSNYGIDTTGFATGLTADFKGATSVSGAFSHDAVNLAGSGTTTFDGGLTLNQTGGGSAAFATLGGTVGVYGGASSITTTTGAAVNMVSTAIDATHNVTFDSITTGTVATTPAIALSNDTGGSFNGGTTTIAGVTGADGIKISGGSMSAAANFGATTISGTTGATSAGIEVNGTGTGAVSFSSVAINQTGGDGVLVTNSSHAVTISGGSIGGGAGDPAGDDLHVTGGIGAVSVAASLTKTTAGSVVDVDTHGTGNVTVSGAISATGAVNDGIVVNANTGGTIAFTGHDTLTTGANAAVNLTGNTGATVNFTGGNLAITTTAGTGFNATGGGTVNVTGTGNTISSTTGTALDIENTTIGGSNVTFQSISSTASNGTSDHAGIVLDTTGSSGHLAVTGTGTAGSGGTISNKAGSDILNGSDSVGQTTNGNVGTGIFLHNTNGATFNDMALHDFSNFAIYGNTVNGFTLTNSTISGANGSNNAGNQEEGSIRFDNLTGTSSISNSSISGGYDQNVDFYNTTGGSSSDRVTLNNDTFGLVNAANGNDNVRLQVYNSAVANITLTNSTFQGTRADFFAALANNNATMDAVVRGNTFNNGQTPVSGGGTIADIRANGTNTQVTFDISHNTNDADGLAPTSGASAAVILVGQDSGIGTMKGTIASNTLVAETNKNADGIFERVGGSGTLTTLIQNNTITNWSNDGIQVQNNTGSGVLNTSIFSNTINAPSGTSASPPFAGIYLDAGLGLGDGDHSTINAVIGGSGANAGEKNTISVGPLAGAFADIGFIAEDTGDTINISKNGSASTNPSTVLADDNNLGSHGAQDAGSSGPVNAVNSNPALPPTVAPLQVTQPGPGSDTPTTPTDPTTPTGGDTPTTPATPTGTTTPTGGSTPPPTPSETTNNLTQAQLDTMVASAIAHWAAAGATPQEIAEMKSVSVTVANITGLDVGDATPGHIQISANAAGYGWFVNSTPGDNKEFTGTGTDLTAIAGSAAAGKIDLLTVLMHELGHEIGLVDDYKPANSADLMYGFVNPGERRLPTGDGRGGGNRRADRP